MKLEDAVVRVKKVAKRLQRLEGAVRHRLEPSLAKGRQIPIVFTQSFVFQPKVEFVEVETAFGPVPVPRVTLPMQLVQQPIVNGAEDCYLKEVSYSAFFNETTRASIFDPLPQTVLEPAGDFPNALAPILTQQSYSAADPYKPSIEEWCFNFQWNATLMSTQSNYLSQANNAQFLSRRSLGHASRAVRRQLYSNLLFKAGDALLLSVQPTYWGPPVAGMDAFNPGMQHPSVQLTVSFFGTRGPEMVELAEDSDLEP